MSNDVVSLFGSNAGYLAELYQLYNQDPELVEPAWAEFFRAGGYNGVGAGNGAVASATAASAAPVEVVVSSSADAIAEQAIDAFRRWGHLAANVSPLSAGGMAAVAVPEVLPATYTKDRKSSELSLSQRAFAGRRVSSVYELIGALNETYCGTVGFEFEHITSPAERAWFRERIEGQSREQWVVPVETRKEIFQELLKGDLLESELHRKFVGAKRFSLEGNETLMPLLAAVIEGCARSGVREAVFGMAHRGRLNVLVNTLGKPLGTLFSEFEDKTIATVVGAGDVKYHLGYESEYQRHGATVKLSLAPNPSHLEFVNPVVEGIVRAKQDALYGRDRRSVLPVLMHGDAAFAGQGIVFETINYAALEGYSTGGSLHIVINNQIGFTTTPDESRSTRYCTDLAKGLDIPVFHVNAEDPEGACWIAGLALEYRNAFGKDVIIDLIGHRKHGHNEGDDPTFTQPLTYAEVKTKRPLWQQYAERLIAAGILDEIYVKEAEAEYKRHFAQAHEMMRAGAEGEASALHGKLRSKGIETAVADDNLRGIARQLVAYPDGFVPHPKLAKIIQKRVETVEVGAEIEWGVAEALAFGSLVEDGVPVRLSGQDCRRGTFSHRHLVLDDYEKAGCWSPLGELAERLANGSCFDVYNSSLSEAAVLAFEFGYASDSRRGLVMWEAQFGDFSNGAQCIIDQFICSSEAKWGQLSGVTLLLPHGYEGQGSEHSSARLERYLQLCAEGNMSVCYPTTAAQHFHLLRRQGLSDIKRPLVVMTPKSLLRLPAAMSRIEHFSKGGFSPLIVDAPENKAKGGADTLVLMSGKVYYDVAAAVKEKKVQSAWLARIEELYPFPAQRIAEALATSNAAKVVWVQEEPRNQGAWSYVAPLIKDATGIEPIYVGRPEAAATATGSGKHHAKEQRALVDELLAEVQGQRLRAVG
jgi:2-oxoglutarate dehydrogenase E1 component